MGKVFRSVAWFFFHHEKPKIDCFVIVGFINSLPNRNNNLVKHLGGRDGVEVIALTSHLNDPALIYDLWPRMG